MNHDRAVIICKGKAGILSKSQRQIAEETGLSRMLVNLYFQRHVNLLEEDLIKILKCLNLDQNEKILTSVDASPQIEKLEMIDK